MNAQLAAQALRKPLQFGNLEQIEAIKVLYPPEVDNEGKKRYRVDIKVRIDETIYVYATDKEDASQQGRDGFDLMGDDIEVRVEEAEG